MKITRNILVFGLLTAAIQGTTSARAQAVLSKGHTDIGIGYEAGEFDLHIHSEDGDSEYSPEDAVLQVGGSALQTVPADPAFSFLGQAGEEVYILPQVEDPSLLFLGIGGEELAKGVFEEDRVSFSLRSITGPGHFWLYKVDGFGTPDVQMNSRDGLDEDTVFVTAGSHNEYNWAFSAPGSYTLSFEAGGRLAGGGAVNSGWVEYHFEVVAAPEIVSLTNGHVDLRLIYESSANSNHLSLVVVPETGTTFAASNVVMVVDESAEYPLPANTPFGEAGESVWILPQSPNPGLLYLGLSSEALSQGVFSRPVDVFLTHVDGPGDFFLWQASQLGGLDVKMNSRDGITEQDRTSPLLLSHEHLNWGFSTSGVYHLTFQLSGQRTGETTNITSAPIVLTFHVLPLPSPAETLFQAWQVEHFGAEALEHVKGPDADPDGDQVPNVAEYAFGLDPRSAGGEGLPHFQQVTFDGSVFGAVKFARRAGAADVEVIVEVASSLRNPEWQRLSDQTSSPAGEGRDWVEVRDTVPMGEDSSRFYRVSIRLD